MALAYQTGTVTGVLAFMQALRDFAVAQGWTNDHDASDRLHLHKGTVFASFRWASSTPSNVGVYHALGFSGSGTAPGNHTDDSGQGVVTGTDATLATGRHVPLSTGSITYFFFSDTAYLHAVARIDSDGTYRHGPTFGTLTKHGDGWTGGEYASGWRRNLASSDFDGIAVQQDSNALLDALGNEVAFAASVHVEGIPNQAAGKWGVVGDISAPGNDRGSSARTKVFGGFRGLVGRQFPWSSDSQSGLADAYLIPCLANTNSGADVYLLGYLPNVRGIDLAFYEAEKELVIASQTWKFFPTYKRGVYDGATQSSAYQGIAYRKA